MKVKCINNSCLKYLTNGKTYDIIEEDNYYYLIINDNGNERWLYKTRFESLIKIRNERNTKINKILEYKN